MNSRSTRAAILVVVTGAAIALVRTPLVAVLLVGVILLLPLLMTGTRRRPTGRTPPDLRTSGPRRLP